MSEKGRKLYNGITNIDDDLIMAAYSAKPSIKAAPVKKKRTAMFYVYRWGAAAAAVIALVVVGIIVLPVMTKNSDAGMTMNFAPSNSSVSETIVAEAVDEMNDAISSNFGTKDTEASEMYEDSDSEWEADYSTAPGTNSSDVVLEEDQIYLDIDFDKVEEITLTYAGYDTVVIEASIAEELVDLVNSMGILSLKEDYQDVSTEEYATIEVEMIDGSVLEITPEYPYIFINGKVYECESKARGIYNLALYISDFCKTYYGE